MHQNEAIVAAQHEATLIALRKKQSEAKQNYRDSLERERQKCERTISIPSDEVGSEHQKSLRKMETEWQIVCNGLEKQLGSQQTQVVHLELMRGRIERAGKERVEKLERKACALRQNATVSSTFFIL